MDSYKNCSKCKVKKLKTEFFKKIRATDGRMSWCKTCHGIWGKQYYLLNRERIRSRQTKYFSSRKGRDAWLRASMKRYQDVQERPKWIARARLRYAVKKGEVKKASCFCGEVKVYAHHYLGYEGEHWKDVKWLCYYHHAESHEWKGVWKRR